MKLFRAPSFDGLKASKLMHSLSQMSGYALALFFMKGISILMLPIVTRYLSPEEYGKLELITVSSTLIAMVISGSLHEALYRYVSDPDEPAESRFHKASQLFTLTCLISLIATVILLALLQFSSYSFPTLVESKVLIIVLGSLSIGSSLAIGLAWLRMQEQAKSFVAIAISTTSLQAVLTIVALELGFGIFGVVTATFIGHIIQWLGVKTVSKLRFVMPDIAFSKTCFKYSIPLMLSALVAFGLNGAERWFVLANSSLETLGQYAIAAKFALATCILVQPFGMWWMPKRFAIVKQSYRQAERITQLGIAYICLLVVGVAIFAKLLVPYILEREFHNVSTLIVGTLFMIIGKEVVELVNLGLMLKSKSHVILRINLVTTIVALSICYVVTKTELGVWPIILTVGIAQLLKAAWVYHHSQKEAAIFHTAIPMMMLILTAIGSLIAVYYSNAWFELFAIAVLATIVTSTIAIKQFKPRIKATKTIHV